MIVTAEYPFTRLLSWRKGPPHLRGRGNPDDGAVIDSIPANMRKTSGAPTHPPAASQAVWQFALDPSITNRPYGRVTTDYAP